MIVFSVRYKELYIKTYPKLLILRLFRNVFALLFLVLFFKSEAPTQVRIGIAKVEYYVKYNHLNEAHFHTKEFILIHYCIIRDRKIELSFCQITANYQFWVFSP